MGDTKGYNIASMVGPIMGIVVILIVAGMVSGAAPELPYVCPYCGARFATFDELVAHVQTVHPGERVPIRIIWT